MTQMKAIVNLSVLVLIFLTLSGCTPPGPPRPGEEEEVESSPVEPPVVVIAEDTSVSGFSLTSPMMQNNGVLPVDFTCDGDSLTPPLAWDNPPAGTVSYALLMDHQPGPEDYHWYWVAFGIPADVNSLDAGSNMAGTLGTNSVNDQQAYAPPCSKGPGEKLYTFHLYALSAVAEIADPANADRETLLAAIDGITLATADLDVIFDRDNPVAAESVAAPAEPETVAQAEVALDHQGEVDHHHDLCAEGSVFEAHDDLVDFTCENGTLIVESETGQPSHEMMRGITSWILRVPLTFTYEGDSAWRFPTEPVWLSEHGEVHARGPVAMAVNGVPVYHFDKRPDVDLGAGYVYESKFDTVEQGELDHCGGHAGQGEDYHYHTAPVCLLDDHDLSKPIAVSLGGASIFYGTGATDYYGEGRYNSINNLPDGALTECNGYLLADGSYVYYTTKEPPYVLGCYHEQIDLSQQIEARQMRDLGDFGRDHTEIVSLTQTGDVRTLTFLTDQGELNAVVYQPSAAGVDCWDMQFRTDVNVAVTAETHCRVSQ
ncbi:MAG: phosphatidylethanolamine-binding protein (PEBP) family uncharacterized protein [Candidatus Promineifilaceae bacterium]|jgi:phosphatidylethanolamine-binding protein (PEBP) family uncharacterized protein